MEWPKIKDFLKAIAPQSVLSKAMPFLAALLICQACATPENRQPTSSSQSEQATLVIWDFDDASFQYQGDIDYLARTLPEMLLAELSIYPDIRLLERIELLDALHELKLGSGKLVDNASRLKLGRITGANKMVFGSYLVTGDKIRIDLRVVDTETSLTVYADSQKALLAQITRPVRELANGIAVKLSAGGKKVDFGNISQTNLARWEQYEQGLALMDERKFEQAVGIFQQLLEQHPDFEPAEKQIKLALERLERQ